MDLDEGRFDASPETLRDPAMLLALDEAFLMGAEAGDVGPTFRTWEFTRATVVLGRSSKVDRETDREHCDRHGIQIYRRCSGGASIVGGPGCLMYSVVLSLEQHPQIAKIDEAHDFVMHRVLAAVQRQLPQVRLQGICDLTWRDRKFSGNALRITRRHLLYHGTILYAADLQCVDRCLDFAPRQPDYRRGRDHGSFVTNAPLDPVRLADDLAEPFGPPVGQIPAAILARASELVSNRYSCEDWRFRH
ncbi:lipoate--protein ligase family protein [Rhodopirellula sp. JC639]|uniref:lipoate--protein ligase family protein n=1 Tax=Stieleria mannarensis TaxID=2755585 RepID=UPI001600E193|nr:lipoate--protein ligase family protein [Rhodopirellula sp. JC639]